MKKQMTGEGKYDPFPCVLQKLSKRPIIAATESDIIVLNTVKLGLTQCFRELCRFKDELESVIPFHSKKIHMTFELIAAFNDSFRENSKMFATAMHILSENLLKESLRIEKLYEDNFTSNDISHRQESLGSLLKILSQFFQPNAIYLKERQARQGLKSSITMENLQSINEIHNQCTAQFKQFVKGIQDLRRSFYYILYSVNYSEIQSLCEIHYSLLRIKTGCLNIERHLMKIKITIQKGKEMFIAQAAKQREISMSQERAPQGKKEVQQTKSWFQEMKETLSSYFACFKESPRSFQEEEQNLNEIP